MPTHYTALADKQNKALTGLYTADHKNLTGDLITIDATYTFKGTEVQGDVLRVALAPEVTRIHPHLCFVAAETGTAGTLQLTVGDEDPKGPDAGRYSAAVAPMAANAFVQPADHKVNQHQLSDAAWITATLSTLTAPVAGKKLRFLLVGTAR